ncbi:MAG: TonB-dependent siderophore receptor [Cyanobacteria bacterium P01_H01_bin.21]
MVHRLQCVMSVATAMATFSIVQPVVSAATQINQVQVTVVNGALEIRLETPDGEPQTFTSRFGETVIIDLVNTQLDINDAIVQDNPAAGITSIQVAPLDENSVRITIIGEEQAPTATLVQANGEFLVSISATDAIAEQSPEEEVLPEIPPVTDESLRILVTGEQLESPYLTPETTTTRNDTSIFDIPQTIQVLPQQLLEDQQVTTLEDAILNVPNAVRSGDAGGASDGFAIRGFENAQVLRDGFRDTGGPGAQSGIEELVNVERIEVLSGPASVLYGNLEPGGVINLVTKRPLSEFFLETGVQVDSFGLVRPTLDISGPITEDGNLLYRLNTAYQYSDGFRDFDTDLERFFVSPVLEWQISDRTTLLLDLEYVDDTRPFDRGIPAIGDEVADIPFDTVLGEPDDIIEIDALEAGYRFEHGFSDNWQLRNRLRYSTTDYFTRRAQITLGGPGFNEETGDFPRNFTSNDSELETFEVQTELVGEFTTGPLEHTLLLGVDFFQSDIATVTTTTPSFPVPGLPFPPPVNVFDPEIGRVDIPETPLPLTVADVETDLSQVGLIFQDQIQVLPNLNILLGGRLDIISQDSQAAAIFIPGFADTPASSEQNDFTNFSPQVGVVYQPFEPLSFYASYSQSFTPNTLGQTTIDGEFLDPEEAEQFEIGAKAELLDGRLAVTLALFDLTLENVAATDPNNPEFVVPIGEQTSRGVELVVQGEILPGWNVVASYGFLDAEIAESGGAFPEGAVPRGVAENTASLFTTYEIQSGALAGLGFGLGAFFVGDRPGDAANTFDVGSFVRTDASVFYQTDRLRVGLDFENIFDVDYISGVFNRVGAVPGESFNVLGSIAVTF